MNMKKEQFRPYKKMIMIAISRTETIPELEVCNDMFDGFKKKFKDVVEDTELREAVDEVEGLLQYKSDSINQ